MNGTSRNETYGQDKKYVSKYEKKNCAQSANAQGTIG